MSAVSSESPRAAADLSAPSDNHNSPSTEPAAGPGRADFGPNEWLVDELYQRYLADPGSVDRAWWSFFADYRPRGNGTGPQPVMQEGGPAETRMAPPAPRQLPQAAAPASTASTASAPSDLTAPPAAPAAPATPTPKPAGPAPSAAPATPPPADAELAKLRGEEQPPGKFQPGQQGFFSRLRDAFNGR